MASVLASLPRRFHTDRAELLQLLLQNGILYRTPAQPVVSRDGTPARWMLNSLAVTLAARGAELAGRCMLEILKRFDGRQVATYGLTGVPILESCILQSGGRYHGLLVRKERKKAGSLKLVEGTIDPDEPTILLDDSISSGISITDGVKRLEEAGLRVEGAACLVRFGWYSGFAAMQERGYHMEAVYDIYEDFMARMEGEPAPVRNPSKWFPEFEWSAKQAPEGLHPAHLARLALMEYLSSGKLLRPPERLDADYDSSGGAWVSVRSREDIYWRHARDGFWHFPGEPSWGPAEDVVRAALRTATQLTATRKGQALVQSSHIAVTFFSALEECTVGQLDNDRYGIVVCSRERPEIIGGALPRMPGIGGDWAQFQHARRKNARLVSFEPYRIYRHDVVKVVEPGVEWQPTGVPLPEEVPWHRRLEVCGLVAQRARDIVAARLLAVEETTLALPDGLLPAELDSIYISVYIHRRLRGCMGSAITGLDEDVRALALAALQDDRFDAAPPPHTPADVTVVVAFLHNALTLGRFSKEEVVDRIRHGQHALMAFRGKRAGLLLPIVAVTNNLDPADFAAAVIKKAGIQRPPYYWRRFECSAWVADGEGAALLDGAFKAAEAGQGAGRGPGGPPHQNTLHHDTLEDLLCRLAELHTGYLLRHQQDNGSFYFRYEPFQNVLYEGICPPRLGHAGWVLARAGRALGGASLRKAADRTLSYHQKMLRGGKRGLWLESAGEPPSIAEVAFLLLALCELPKSDKRRSRAADLAATLWSSIDRHGRILTHRDPARGLDAYQDYFPGQALLALASAVQAGITAPEEPRLYRAFRYYRHRFRFKRSFGPVSWLMQAFSRWWRVTRDPAFAELVFEIGGWILEHQQEKTGAFINDHQPDTPGYTTALYLEGVGAAVKLAAETGNRRRYETYRKCYERGIRFVDRLVIQPRDASLLPNRDFAIGGVRQSLTSSEVRIDFVQHSLSAVLELHPSAARVDREAAPAYGVETLEVALTGR